MDPIDFPPDPSSLVTEADVEQKVLWRILTLPPPHGLGLPPEFVFCKPSIRRFDIGKGSSAKLYFPDFVVPILGFPLLIVEAKAPGEDLDAASVEARLYATELNSKYPPGLNPCAYCVVSDGLTTQLRSWDSTEPLCVFTLAEANPASVTYATFVDTLAQNQLRAHAAEINRKIRPRRYDRPVNLIGGTSARDERIEYNDFGKVLTSRFQHLFNPNTWEDRKRIAREAYVASRRRTRYVDEIDHIIKVSAPPSVTEATLIEDTSKPVEIAERMSVPQELRNKILLLIGAVGSGKSTFVDYLQEIGLPPELQSATAWVRVDLNEAPISADEIYKWCRTKLINGIKQTSPDLDVTGIAGLKLLYRKHVTEFDAGIGSLFSHDSPEYKLRLADLLERLKNDSAVTLQELERYLCTGRGRLLVVGLDNCDKRNRDEQLLMFQVAKWIQQEIRCLVILPLRQETFENHRHEPPLDTALQDLIFRIQPPPFQEVLSKRLGLVMAEAKILGSKNLSYHMGRAEVTFPADKLERLLHKMMGSLFEHNQYGRRIIVGLAGWNIRRALEIFLDFCRSGYIDEKTIFQTQTAGEHQFIQPGVIARILLRTNRRYYDGDLSYVKNLFQCDPNQDAPDHFIRYRVLAWLRNHNTDKGPSGIKGFHRIAQVVQAMVIAGSDENAAREEVRYLLREGCIVSEHLRSVIASDEDLIAITPAGHVHIDLAHNDFHYLAACAEDCWLASPQLAETIRRRITIAPFWKSLSWPITLDSANDFVKYLKEQKFQRVSPGDAFLSDSLCDIPDIDLEEIERDIQLKIGHLPPKNGGGHH